VTLKFPTFSIEYVFAVVHPIGDSIGDDDHDNNFLMIEATAAI
jgi:hypothetical protein